MHLFSQYMWRALCAMPAMFVCVCVSTMKLADRQYVYIVVQ